MYMTAIGTRNVRWEGLGEGGERRCWVRHKAENWPRFFIKYHTDNWLKQFPCWYYKIDSWKRCFIGYQSKAYFFVYRPERNPFLYLVAVHHIHSFIFKQSEVWLTWFHFQFNTTLITEGLVLVLWSKALYFCICLEISSTACNLALYTTIDKKKSLASMPQ